MTLFPISKNQPIDYPTLQTMVSKINDIDVQVNLKSAKSQFKETAVNTGDMVIVSLVENIIQSSVKAGESKAFTATLGNATVSFKSPPVVTATVARSGNASIDGAYAMITNVSNDKVEGLVFFTKDGGVDLNVNIIAVGISNLEKS